MIRVLWYLFQLKAYTEQRAVQRSYENNIGFTTPNQTVSSTINLSRQRAEVIIVNIYSFFMCFFYAVGVYSFLKYFYPSYEEQISTYIRNHKELVSGLTVTTVLSVAIEILTRTINSAVWSASIDSSFGALIAVWLPQGSIFFMGTCVNICCHIVYLKKPPSTRSNSEETTENKGGDPGETAENKDTINDTDETTENKGGDPGETTDNKDTFNDTDETTENEDTDCENAEIRQRITNSEEIRDSGEAIEMINHVSGLEEAYELEQDTRKLVTNSEKSTELEDRTCLDCFIRFCDAIATKFSVNINVHILLPLTLTAYGIIYTAFPTFILMVTYPTQVIMIVPTALALLFATVIFSAIMFKLLNYKLSELSTRREKIINTLKFIVCRFIPFYIVVLLLKSVAVIFLYLLIIARDSFATGLLLTLLFSTMPTVLIAGISWIAKKTMLDKKKENTF